MFKKLNIKVLIAILVILGGIFLYTETTRDTDRSFSRVLVAVDTARVTQIHIRIPKDNADLSLTRSGDYDWQISADGSTFDADRNVVRNILGQFHEIAPERIAATSETRWDEYEVSEEQAVRVSVLSGSRTLADVYFGKFTFTQPPQTQPQMQMQQQQQGTMTSFVRKAGEDRVYAVEGFLRMSYQSDINAYRNKQLVNVPKDDISRVSFSYPETRFTVERVNNRWMINDQPADSLKTERYLSRIARLTSSNFVPAATPKISDASHVIKIEGNNFSPVELKAFPTSDTLINHVVTSSMNPQAEFNGAKAQLYERTFVDETGFLPEDE